MAIRGPGGPPRPDAATSSPQPLREQATSPLQRLVDFGMARTPAEAMKVLREIVSLLGGAGFPVPKAGSPDQQLQTALKAFQQEKGLPVTGKLDEATSKALEQAGLLPGRSGDVDTGRTAPKDGVDRGGPLRPGLDLTPRFGPGGGGGDGPASSSAPTAKGRTIETEQAAARVEHSRPDVEVDLRSMLGSLREAGFAGAGKGKEQLTDAVKKLQRVDGLPVTGKLDAATASALEKRGVLDSTTAQVLREQDPTWAPPAASPSSSSSSSSSANESAPAPAQDGSGAGRGDVAGSGGGRGTDGGSGTGTDQASGTTANGDAGGQSDDIGNNYAGDLDDDDERRALANRDDDDATADAFGHWEVPRLGSQIEAAFDGIVRDDDGRGASTYGWEVHLHRPGVYAARQPAEEILKLVVAHAGPFDPVWQQAIDALNVRLARFDPEAARVDAARLKLALQRARYRDVI